MSASNATLKAFTDAAADAVARAIAGVQREAERAEALRAAEHRAFMAEQREAMAAMTRQIADRLAAVRDGRDGIDGRNQAEIDPAVIQAMVAEAVAGIALPEDGKGADTDLIRQMVAERVDAAVAALPPGPEGAPGINGKDGADAQPFDDTAIWDAEQARAAEFCAFIDAQRSAIAGLMLAADERLLAVQDGRDGKDGADADVSAVIEAENVRAEIFTALVKKAHAELAEINRRADERIASLRDGAPGVDGRDGDNGDPGPVGPIGPPGRDGASFVSGHGQPVDDMPDGTVYLNVETGDIYASKS